MTTIDFITQLFCRVDDKLAQANKNQKHTKANLYPSEVVTIALLFALKGVGNRAFYRWIANNYKSLFPNLPERTRLFRLFNRHHHLTDMFMANPSLIGVIDTYGIELIHPRREGRCCGQIGKKGARLDIQSTMDCRWQTVCVGQPFGIDCGLGLCHSQCLRWEPFPTYS